MRSGVNSVPDLNRSQIKRREEMLESRRTQDQRLCEDEWDYYPFEKKKYELV
jgi:hypothetical protein